MTVQCQVASFYTLYIFKYILFRLTLRTDGILFLDEPGVVAGLGVAGDGTFFVLNSPTPCQIEIIHKVYPPVLHVLYACVYMLCIHLMYNLCSRSKYTCFPLWCITRVALDV